MKFFEKISGWGDVAGSSEVSKKVSRSGKVWSTQQLMKVPATSVGGKTGTRYYMGSGSSKGLENSGASATMNARTKMRSTPADSITTSQAMSFLKKK